MRPSLRPVLAVALVAALARALTVAGLELYVDEAYYWLWSGRPAWGYFDHPPMVAWLIAATRGLGGEWAIRLPFVVCGALAVVFAGLTARELSPHPRAPLYGALLAAGAPLLHVTGALALPDAPLEAAYAAAVWLLATARGRRWVWAGVPVGLALLSKYSAALLAPALVLLVAWDRELREELRTPWPWLGAAVAVGLFLPTLWWDATRGFPSIGFQLHHGFRPGATLRTFVEFVGAQIGAAGPVTLVAGVAGLSTAWRRGEEGGSAPERARRSAWKRVAAATLLPFAVVLYSAARGDGEPNWAAHCFAPLAGAAGAWLAGRHRARAWIGASVGLTAVAAVAFGYVVRAPRFAQTTLYYRFNGWKAAVEAARPEVEALCRAQPPCDPADPFIIPVSYRLSPLAYYSGWLRLGTGVDRTTQLSIWGEHPRPGETVIVLAHGAYPFWEAQQRLTSLVQTSEARRVVVRAGGKQVRELFIATFRPR